jgi:hypothetical protein
MTLRQRLSSPADFEVCDSDFASSTTLLCVAQSAGDEAGRRDTGAGVLLAAASKVAGRKDTGTGAKAAAPTTAFR